MRLTNIRKILFITLSNIGDVVLTLPVLSALRDNFRDADIDVVVGPRPKEIFAKDPRIHKILVYDKHEGIRGKIDFIRELRGRRYDLAIDMRTSLIPFLIGARYRTGLVSLNKNIKKHKKEVHLDKLKPLGIRYREQRNIYIDDKDRQIIGRLLEEKGLKKGDILVGISPATRSPLKQWRRQGFIEVSGALLRNKNLKMVLIGDAAQVDTSREIEKAVNNENLIDLTGEIDLNRLFALIERMHVLLACDSASMHIAADLGVKVVAIFGPTDPREYGPTGKDDIVIRKKLECSPCKKAICNFNHECMEEIKAKEVLEAMKSLLSTIEVGNR